MLLASDQLAVQEAVRAYVRAEIAPRAAEWDRTHHFPKEQLRGLAALGCYGVAVPVEWDGAGLDYLTLSVVLEEIAAGDGATSTVVSVNNCPVCSILMAFGSDEQKQRFLRPLARGDMLGAFCLTEPHVGSEAGGLRTTAARVGDEYVLNGVKQFVTSGQNADVAIVMAVTDKAAGKKGISAFLVPTATPGYTVARLEEKLGQHASDTAQIVFENCRVPAANRLADEGMGLRIALSGLEGGRIGIASQAVGMARAAFEAAQNVIGQRGRGDRHACGAVGGSGVCRCYRIAVVCCGRFALASRARCRQPSTVGIDGQKVFGRRQSYFIDTVGSPTAQRTGAPSN